MNALVAQAGKEWLGGEERNPWAQLNNLGVLGYVASKRSTQGSHHPLSGKALSKHDAIIQHARD